MRYKYKVLLIIVASLLIVPPFLNLIISIHSPFGFIPLNEKSTWINFYGAIIGGSLTLVGYIIYRNDAPKRSKGKRKRKKARIYQKE